MSRSALVVHQRGTVCIHFFNKLKDLKESSQFCDLVFELGLHKFDAHKLVVSAWSPAIYDLLKDGQKGNVVKVQYDNQEVFGSFLAFLYSGQMNDVAQQNIIQILHLATSLQVTEVRQVCEETLKRQMEISNIISTYHVARKFRLPNLEEHATSFMQLNLPDAVKQEDFLSLTPPRFNSFLSSGWVCIMKPEVKLFLIISWLGYDVRERQQYLVLLLRYIDWSTVANDFLNEICQTENFFTTNESSLYLLLQTLFSSSIPLGPYTDTFPALRKKYKHLLEHIVEHSYILPFESEEYFPVTFHLVETPPTENEGSKERGGGRVAEGSGSSAEENWDAQDSNDSVTAGIGLGMRKVSLLETQDSAKKAAGTAGSKKAVATASGKRTVATASAKKAAGNASAKKAVSAVAGKKVAGTASAKKAVGTTSGKKIASTVVSTPSPRTSKGRPLPGAIQRRAVHNTRNSSAKWVQTKYRKNEEAISDARNTKKEKDDEESAGGDASKMKKKQNEEKESADTSKTKKNEERSADTPKAKKKKNDDESADTPKPKTNTSKTKKNDERSPDTPKMKKKKNDYENADTLKMKTKKNKGERTATSKTDVSPVKVKSDVSQTKVKTDVSPTKIKTDVSPTKITPVSTRRASKRLHPAEPEDTERGSDAKRPGKERREDDAEPDSQKVSSRGNKRQKMSTRRETRNKNEKKSEKESVVKDDQSDEVKEDESRRSSQGHGSRQGERSGHEGQGSGHKGQRSGRKGQRSSHESQDSDHEGQGSSQEGQGHEESGHESQGLRATRPKRQAARKFAIPENLVPKSSRTKSTPKTKAQLKQGIIPEDDSEENNAEKDNTEKIDEANSSTMSKSLSDDAGSEHETEADSGAYDDDEGDPDFSPSEKKTPRSVRKNLRSKTPKSEKQTTGRRARSAAKQKLEALKVYDENGDTQFAAIGTKEISTEVVSKAKETSKEVISKTKERSTEVVSKTKAISKEVVSKTKEISKEVVSKTKKISTGVVTKKQKSSSNSKQPIEPESSLVTEDENLPSEAVIKETLSPKSGVKDEQEQLLTRSSRRQGRKKAPENEEVQVKQEASIEDSDENEQEDEEEEDNDAGDDEIRQGYLEDDDDYDPEEDDDEKDNEGMDENDNDDGEMSDNNDGGDDSYDDRSFRRRIFSKRCGECDYSAPSQRRLQSHVDRVHGSKATTFACSLCVFECQYNRAFYEHMKTHFKGPPFTCEFPGCEMQMDRIQSLLIHRRCHSDERPHKCNLCDMRFKTRNNLLAHLKCHTDEKHHECSVCHRRFRMKNTMEQHMVTHSDARPFLCDTCGFSTKFQSHLIAHKRIHTGEVFTCSFPMCAYKTPKKSQLKAHMRSHLNIRQHVCETCEKTFVERSHLIRHQKIHSDIRPFKCDQCEYCSTRVDKVNEHKRKYHSEEAAKKRKYRYAPRGKFRDKKKPTKEARKKKLAVIAKADPLSRLKIEAGESEAPPAGLKNGKSLKVKKESSAESGASTSTGIVFNRFQRLNSDPDPNRGMRIMADVAGILAGTYRSTRAKPKPLPSQRPGKKGRKRAKPQDQVESNSHEASRSVCVSNPSALPAVSTVIHPQPPVSSIPTGTQNLNYPQPVSSIPTGTQNFNHPQPVSSIPTGTQNFNHPPPVSSIPTQGSNHPQPVLSNPTGTQNSSHPQPVLSNPTGTQGSNHPHPVLSNLLGTRSSNLVSPAQSWNHGTPTLLPQTALPDRSYTTPASSSHYSLQPVNASALNSEAIEYSGSKLQPLQQTVAVSSMQQQPVMGLPGQQNPPGLGQLGQLPPGQPPPPLGQQLQQPPPSAATLYQQLQAPIQLPYPPAQHHPRQELSQQHHHYQQQQQQQHNDEYNGLNAFLSLV